MDNDWYLLTFRYTDVRIGLQSCHVIHKETETFPTNHGPSPLRKTRAYPDSIYAL